MKLYLVVNENKNTLVSFTDQYKVFDYPSDAITHAKSIGYQDPFGMGINDKDGMCNIYQCGDIKVSIIPMHSIPLTVNEV